MIQNNIQQYNPDSKTNEMLCDTRTKKECDHFVILFDMFYLINVSESCKYQYIRILNLMAETYFQQVGTGAT